MSNETKVSGPEDVLAENVEVRLWDSQWVNVVNHADCYRDMDKEEAIATAVRITERLMAENITKGFPPSAYNRVAVAELIEAARRAAVASCRGDDFHPGTIRNADLDALRAALSNIGSAP